MKLGWAALNEIHWREVRVQGSEACGIFLLAELLAGLGEILAFSF